MNRIAILLVSTLLIVSCGNTSESDRSEEVLSNKKDREIIISEIDSLENAVYTDSVNLDSPGVAQLMQNYLKYSSKYIADLEKSPEFLYKAAALSRATGLPVKAIKLYSQILVDYPNFKRNSETAFLLAFTYDEDLDQKDLAKEAYQEVIDKFPGDIWAQQAEERLKTIDMSDEELIELFMKNNQSAEKPSGAE